MSNALAEQQSGEVAPVDFDLIRRMYAKDCTNDEFRVFCQMAQNLGLNPALHQIWAVKYPGGGPATFIVGRDGLLEVAHRDPAFDGMESDTNGSVEGGDLTGWCRVYRKDMSHPFTVTVHYVEYVQRKSSGEITKFWKEKPRTMIQKVAEAQALRRAFRISGVYCEDEMPPAEIRVVTEAPTPTADGSGNPNKCSKCGCDINPEHIAGILEKTDGVVMCDACFSSWYRKHCAEEEAKLAAAQEAKAAKKAEAKPKPAPKQEPKPKPAPKPPTPEQPKTVCQSCGKEISPGTTHCLDCVKNECGIPPEKASAPEPAPVAAPEPTDGPVCTHCGKALTEKEVMVCQKLLGGALCCAGCLAKIQRGEIEA